MSRKDAILVRLSKEEKQIFEIMSTRKGLSVSAYIRSVILDLYYASRKESINGRG